MQTFALTGFYLALFLYLFGLVLYYIRFFRLILLKRNFGLLLTLFGFVLHTTFTLARGIHLFEFDAYNLRYSLFNVAWVMTLTFLLLHLRWRVGSLGAFVMPIPIGLLLYALVIRQDTTPLVYGYRGVALTMHMICLVVALACFACTFVLAVAYLVVRKGLKTKNLSIMSYPLPSLQTLDQAGLFLLKLGFPFITLGILWGILLWSQGGPALQGGLLSKEVMVLATWLVYAALLAGRYFFRLGGRRGAYLAIVGFLCALVALLGVGHSFEGHPWN
jgi:ABC-type transport system involved in cytochrome c biogenesis permease subunit